MLMDPRTARFVGALIEMHPASVWLNWCVSLSISTSTQKPAETVHLRDDGMSCYMAKGEARSRDRASNPR